MGESTKRIEWIDLAKGICIFLVVFHHVAVSLCMSYPLSTQITSFRMPLYFILSGLFFKTYEGFCGFIKRKINKLLIPFLFFLVTTSVIPYAIISHDLSLKFFFTDMNGPIYNYAIWFLLCLFEINLLFYLIQEFSRRCSPNGQTMVVLFTSIILGCCGLLLGVARVWNPLYVCTTLTALPFFAFGWWLRWHTQFLSSPIRFQWDIPLLLVGLILVFICAVRVVYAFNYVPTNGAIYVHICGIAGTMMILMISKMIKKLPLLSFWGRYSIMILCTHQVIIFAVGILFKKVLSGIPLFMAVLSITLFVCHLSILVMKRYMPHVTAQKDVIKV